MAPKKTPSFYPSVPISIGNCEVIVQAKNFTSESNQNSLQISLSKSTRIEISVVEGKSHEGNNDILKPDSKGISGDYYFILVNPKDSDDQTKSLLQEVLNIYTKELPAMNYAANTGKQSMFLERCVSNGKYCTLLLKSNGGRQSGEVVAAITYQIIPVDAQYAEIPLAAVSSVHQRKGIGSFLFSELKKRLQDVGIRTIFCWGDKESEGFWLKQDFVKIGEVDMKGRARRLPIKADIRRALCFPGGSTLMVSHMNKDNKPAEDLKLSVPLKPPGSSCPVKQLKTMTKSQDSLKEVQNSQLEYLQSENTSEGTKKRTWETSCTSLKSKKVKGTHLIVCQSNDPVSGCIDGISSNLDGIAANSGSQILMGNTPKGPLSDSCIKQTVDGATVNITSADHGSLTKTMFPGKCFRVMLMNIADDNKKSNLTKIIEDLGGVVTSDGSVSTHVVTGKVRRTLNFCTALCSGSWIVSPSWLKESFRSGRFLDESSFILKDDEYELKYRTELKDAVLRAKANPQELLKDYDICLAAHIEPPVSTLSAIVKSAGGNAIRGLDKVSDPSRTIYVACEEDMLEALLAVKKGIRSFSSEWFMNCIMKQELDLEAHQFAESL